MWKWIKALNPFAVQLRNTEARLEFARVLLAQAEIELADKAFYVREFAAVSAERDGLKAEFAQHIAWQEAMVMDIAHVRAERDAFRAKLQRVNDHNQTITEGYKVEIAAMRERASVPVPAGVPSVDPTDDQVEALARVLRAAYMKECHVEPSDCPPNKGYLAEARAAIAHLSKRPEGLPTLMQIEDAYYADPDRTTEPIEFTLDYLRPWLRDPVGCELDVTAIDIANIIRGEAKVIPIDAPMLTRKAKPILDLCRSRIKPVYECKECAGLKQRLHHAAVAWRKIKDDEASDALDAALEGE